MIGTKTAGVSPLVVVGTGAGVTLIPSPTQLTRLNYFDGKFLRAEDLSAEQNYLRSLVQLSNQAGGAGVVHGFDTRLGAGGALELGPGLGIDRAGRVLLLPHPTSVGVAELIEKSRNPAGGGGAAKKGGGALFGGCAEPAAGPPPAAGVLPAELYLVVLGHAEALCGEEEVYGKLCEDACSPDTNRRFRVEGVVLRAVPVSLDPPTAPFPNAARKHLRSLAASAYFATERARLGREMSGARLRQELWCHPAPLEHWPTEAGEGIPLALLSVTGGTVEWLDMWTARRDRMEPPPRKGWAWQMMMRPWEVFLAQVLQFQCQLADLLAGTPPGGGSDPCEDRYRILERARAILERIERRYDTVPEAVVVQPAQPAGTPPAAMPAPPAAAPAAFAERSAARQKDAAGFAQAGQAGQVRQARPEYLPELAELRKEILVALDEGAPGSARVLVDGGIVELPAAGYLPVVPGREVDEQVRRLLGDGVDLRFCAVRPDYVAHALEEAQHMDRIGLLQGLEDPAKRPEVDVLVPDGEVVEKQAAPAGSLFEVTVRRAGQPSGSIKAGTRRTAGSLQGSMTHLEEQTGGDDAEQGRVLLRGAGRGQRLAGGGGAFHFAGVSGLLGSISIPEDPTSGGTDTPNTADATLRSFMAGGTRGTTGFRVPRVPGIGEALGWMFRGVRTERPAPEAREDTATMEGAAAGTKQRVRTREITHVEVSTPSLENVTLGVWATLRCEGDPFALEAGESVPVRAEAVVGIDGVVIDGEPVPAWARGRIVGDLVCRVPADGGSRTRARLEGAAFGRTRKLGDSADDGSGDQEGSAPLDVPVDLELRPVLGGGSELVATLYVPNDDGLLAVSVATSWRGSPVLAQSVAAMDLLATVNEQLKTATGEKRQALEAIKKSIEDGRYPATLPVLAATARENPAVADAGNAYHADAVRALKALGRVLEDPGFREGAERLLFPPPPRQSGAARVRATRDWVLFHRRRRSSCDCCPGAAVAAPPRRYRVYHAALDDDPSPDEIREALAGDDPPGDENLLQPLGVALEFEGGSAAMLTARGALLDAWRDAGPAPALLYGAIAGAGAGAGDSDALLDGRLDRVVAAVETETPEYPGAAFDVLGRVPSWLSAGTTDGVVILLSTRAGARTECQEVFLVRQSENTARLLRDFLGQGGTRDGLLAFAEPLGEVRYQPGTTTVVGDSLDRVVAEWGAKEPGIPVSAMYLTPSSDDETELRERHEQRARGVLDEIGAQVDPSPTGLPAGVTECDSLLLVVAGSGTATVLHRVIEAVNRDVQQVLARAMTQGQGSGVMQQFQGEVRPLGYVRFSEGTSSAEQPSLDAVVAASGGGGSPVPSVLLAPDRVTPAQVGQAEVIRGALGVTAGATQVAAPLAGNEDVYGDARVVTLVVPG
ncbi:MAG: hypothetical protein AB1941_13920 [Gemmatimonadota bacterium]